MAIPLPEQGTRCAAIGEARDTVRRDIGNLAAQLRVRITRLERQVEREGPLAPADASAVREGLGWLSMLAADLRAAAEPGRPVSPGEPATSRRRRRTGDGEPWDAEAARQRFHGAVWAMFTAQRPRRRAGVSDLRSYVLGPGFLGSFDDQGQRVRSSVLKLVVRVLTGAPAVDEGRRPRQLHALLHAGGTRLQVPGLWAARTNPPNAHGGFLVWRVGPDEIIELVEIVPEDRLVWD